MGRTIIVLAGLVAVVLMAAAGASSARAAGPMAAAPVQIATPASGVTTTAAGVTAVVNGRDVVVSWATVSGADSYTVVVLRAADGHVIFVPVPADMNSIALTLDPGTYYGFVRSCDGFYCTAYSLPPVRFDVTPAQSGSAVILPTTS